MSSLQPPPQTAAVNSAYEDRFAADNLPPMELWPDIVDQLDYLRYPAQINCAGELLDRHAACGWSDRIALRDQNQAWTYQELAERVARISSFLRIKLSLPSGSRVLLHGANSLDFAANFLAIMKAGYIAVPTMPLLRARELLHIIKKARINAILCDHELQHEVIKANEQAKGGQPIVWFGGNVRDEFEREMMTCSPQATPFPSLAQDICLISFTSGTTGVPKATMHTHRDLLCICDCFPKSILNVACNDVFIGTPPLAFTFGLGGLLLFPLRYGASAILLARSSPHLLLENIQKFQATICFTAPTFYRQMLAHTDEFDVRSLRVSVSAGEVLPSATRQAWYAATGLQMVDGIGSTEMLHIFISSKAEDSRAGATGKPIPGYQACILDEWGQQVGPGIIGRLAVKGPTGCRYLNDERQRKYVYNGWNITGDAYEMDADGYFYFRARIDDMIISSGYNIAGPEVEDALLNHPAVNECAVVGVPDVERNHVVKAFVVLNPGVQADEQLLRALQEHVKNTIAPYKYPRQIQFVASLPRTETGKLQRFKLRASSFFSE